ncbi:hypothetical protein OM076_22970 [Solirubrobacter ginsenosidimutans]|uniref:Right handed beta helix domain-containing protein n=1 Tax=Solirubrobacter ginsenosidimutans TaxID=490573 RepID=A0A9X3S252_9ACTN|nr:hypothetical protein [Solirubrobacter ginsenosidimutans]MDA0163154.1 hypothetical protein [Solirubrobacter ginsenosidimutans]
MPMRLLFVASALATFVLIPSAQAATYCVGDPTCQGVAEPTLTAALTAADQTPELDAIELGIGEYTGHFKNAAGRPVRISGMGPLTTIAPDVNNAPALTITGSSSTVSNVGVELGHSTVLGMGMRLDGGASGDGITVTAASGAINDTGIELGAGASLTRTDIRLGGLLLGMIGVKISGDGVTVSDLDINAAIGVYGLGDAVVRRTRIASAATGMNLSGGNTRVSSTLLDVREGGHGIDASARADVAQVTIVGADTPGRIGLRATGSGALKVRDSIVAGMQTAYSAGAPATISLDHVVRDPAAKEIGAVVDANPITIAPQFAGLGTAPFALAPGSALVDTGSDAPLAADESAWDLSGDPRISDGTGDCVARRDPGAYETAAAPCVPVAPAATPAPVATPAPPTAPPANTDRTAPKLTKLKLTRAKLTFTLSEAATAKVTVQRKRGKRYVIARKLTKTSRAGANSVALRLRTGHYRVLVDVVDLAGNRVSAHRSL